MAVVTERSTPVNAVCLEYDTARYPFARILEREVFRVKPLDQLHVFFARQKQKAGEERPLKYSDNLSLRNLMQRLPDDCNFYRMYHLFIKNEIVPHYGGKFTYSAHPKMRVHLAGTPSVSLWHRDLDITGRVEQINVFLPFTECAETNALWCESAYDAGDFQPVPLRYGQAFLFDGGCLSHGSVHNTTDRTRVSLDFRFSTTRVEGVQPPWSTILSARSEAVAIARSLAQTEMEPAP